MSSFFDSNILVYAFSADIRRERALTTIAGGGVISAQVLNEFTNVLRKKQRQDWSVIEAAVQAIRFRFPDVTPLTADTHVTALALARDHTLAFYGALIVAAAIEAGCETLYSEDMQHGRSIGGLSIVNPFFGSTSSAPEGGASAAALRSHASFEARYASASSDNGFAVARG